MNTPSTSVLLLLLYFTLTATFLSASDFHDNPIEAGKVHWLRDFDEAATASKQSGKPLLVLFQEIPGCLGCRTFGQEVLSHPLLVEAIETEFHPVLVYNNRPGTNDDELRRRYHEPAWNYQVIRFLDHSGKDIIPREDQIWDIAGVAVRMIAALEKSGRNAPLYLRAVQLEEDTSYHQTIGLSMSCFWTGEYQLGKLDGVVTTEAGWYDNREITLTTYHTELISLEELLDYAEAKRCARKVYLPHRLRAEKTRLNISRLDPAKYHKAQDSDQKKQLKHFTPELVNIAHLSEAQQTKINSLIPDLPDEALMWLSPSQMRQYQELVQQF